jgi:hypothetical protein
MADLVDADGKPASSKGPSAVEVLDGFFRSCREKRAKNGDVSKTELINAVLALCVIVNAQQAQINALLPAKTELKMLTEEEVARLDEEARKREAEKQATT